MCELELVNFCFCISFGILFVMNLLHTWHLEYDIFVVEKQKYTIFVVKSYDTAFLLQKSQHTRSQGKL